MFHKGQRVLVKAPAPWDAPGAFKIGTVFYQRMRPPNYSQPEAVSVLLDDEVEAMNKPPFPNYSGTIFPAEQVIPMITPERAGEIYAHMQNTLLSKGKEETKEESEQIYFLWTLCPRLLQLLAEGHAEGHSSLPPDQIK